MWRFVGVFVLILAAGFGLELWQPVQERFVLPWTALVAKASSAVIHLFSDNIVTSGNHITALATETRPAFAIQIVAGCNGVEAMLILIAGMLAYPASWKEKLVGIAIGIPAVQVINVARVVTLFYLGQYNEEAFKWAHEYIWQVLIMLDVLFVWLGWLRYLGRNEVEPAEPNDTPTPPTTPLEGDAHVNA